MINSKTIGAFLSSWLLCGCIGITTTSKQIFKIEGKVFDQDVIVVVTEDKKFAHDFVKSNYYSDSTPEDFNSRGTTYPSTDGKPVVIWLPHTKDIGVNNHELIHATISIMNWAGLELSEQTEEVYGYEMQYLSTEFYKKIDYARRIN